MPPRSFTAGPYAAAFVVCQYDGGEGDPASENDQLGPERTQFKLFARPTRRQAREVWQSRVHNADPAFLVSGLQLAYQGSPPGDQDGVDALGAAAGDLSGSAKWYAWKTEEDLKGNRAFKELGVSNFRSKDARALRDEWFKRRSMGFVHQAARYRGKANYREALFLAYGSGTETILSGYVEDMHAVLKAFLAMAGAFARRKLGKDLWSEFVADVDAKKAFTTRAGDIWA